MRPPTVITCIGDTLHRLENYSAARHLTIAELWGELCNVLIFWLSIDAPIAIEKYSLPRPRAQYPAASNWIGAVICVTIDFQQWKKPMPSPHSALALTVIFLLATTARAAQVGSVQQGHQLAREFCAECHLLGEEAGQSTNANAPTFKEIADTPGMTGAALRASWQSWHKNMPNLIIKGEDADSLVAYILSLRKPD
jgi:mono/diheme cytochrome c family protein